LSLQSISLRRPRPPCAEPPSWLPAGGRLVLLHVRLGHPAARIRESAAQIGIDLRVLAPSAKAWLVQVLLGSVTDAVLNHAGCDTLVAGAPCIARRARE
jgi:nucleotide-binding universal stress UspA family protein